MSFFWGNGLLEGAGVDGRGIGDDAGNRVPVSRKPSDMKWIVCRAGMHAEVVAQVMASAPPRIVYVSCNPATLARDLGLMKEVYRVVEVQPVDMFPHTFHIETVALLERRG